MSAQTDKIAAQKEALKSSRRYIAELEAEVARLTAASLRDETEIATLRDALVAAQADLEMADSASLALAASAARAEERAACAQIADEFAVVLDPLRNAAAIAEAIRGRPAIRLGGTKTVPEPRIDELETELARRLEEIKTAADVNETLTARIAELEAARLTAIHDRGNS